MPIEPVTPRYVLRAQREPDRELPKAELPAMAVDSEFYTLRVA